MQDQQISVLVVEDHEMIFAGIKSQLNDAQPYIDLNHANSINVARTLIETLSPNIIIQDLLLPDGDGIRFFDELRSSGVCIPTILMSGNLSGVDIQRGLTAGIDCIVAKEDSVDELLRAFDAIRQNKPYFSKTVALYKDNLEDEDFLTPRSLEVLTALQTGLSNKEIAAQLEISEPTVSFHLAQLKKRLGARNNRQLVFRASRLGLLRDMDSQDKTFNRSIRPVV